MKERISEIPFTAKQEQEPPICIPQLSAIDTMGVEELRRLVQRISDARWGDIALMDNERRVDAIVDRLVHTALTTQDKREARESGKEALNRIQGTAVQRQAIIVKNETGDSAEDLRAVDAFLAGFVDPNTEQD